MRKLNLKRKKKLSLKVKYKILKICFIMVSFLLFLTVYMNYNYILFKIFISENYIYTYTLDEIYYNQIKLKDKNYFKNFDNVAISLFIDEIKKTNNDKYTYFYLPFEYDNSQEHIRLKAQKTQIKEINKDVVYLRISNFSKYSKNIIFSKLEELKNHKNIIIDLRDNLGGSLSSAYEIADLFLEKRKIIAYEKTRIKLFSSRILSKNNKKLEYDNIYIIQNKNSASSSEVLISALKYNLDNITIVGEKSFGKGIGQTEFILKNGFAVKATTLKLKTPYNNSIHQIGILPDIEYEKDDIVNFTFNLIDKN